ncbi:MAG: efflux RND transporter periplasmic adaptor subunit [Anaerolineae bacterium]|jgi:HlyD family secretion protein|nr:efflux RND transporter periplasmic adaptor subunit [Anaerolineae bacterium]
MKMRRLIIIIVALAVIAVVVCVGGGQIASRMVPNIGTPTPVTTPVALQAIIKARGQVLPVRQGKVSFRTSGIVGQVLVAEGDVVEEGRLLAVLDTTNLNAAVQNAEDAVALQEAALAKLKVPPAEEDIAAAEAELASAQAALSDLLALPDEEAIELARIALEQARNSLWSAQSQRDAIPSGGPLRNQAEAAVANAELAVRVAEIEYQRAQKGADAKELAAARARVAQARATLAKLKAGPNAEELRAAELAVQQVQHQLDQARQALDDVELRAPFSGTLVSFDLREGDLVAAGAPVATLADLSEFVVETTDLDEWGVARIAVGQPVKLVFTAFDDKTLSGKITKIAAQPTTLATGDVAYTVTIALDKQDPELRWGMTARVEFEKVK